MPRSYSSTYGSAGASIVAGATARLGQPTCAACGRYGSARIGGPGALVATSYKPTVMHHVQCAPDPVRAAADLATLEDTETAQ